MQVSITSETAWSRAFMQVHLQVLRLQSSSEIRLLTSKGQSSFPASSSENQACSPFRGHDVRMSGVLMADALRAMKWSSSIANWRVQALRLRHYELAEHLTNPRPTQSASRPSES